MRGGKSNSHLIKKHLIKKAPHKKKATSQIIFERINFAGMVELSLVKTRKFQFDTKFNEL